MSAVKFEIKGQGHWKRKCKIVKSGSIYVRPRPKWSEVHSRCTYRQIHVTRNFCEFFCNYPGGLHIAKVTLSLDVSSARIKDTLGHTSTPVFSVDCCLLCIFPCHANRLQISRYGVNPVRSRPSGSSGARDHLPSCGLLWYPVIFHAQHMSQPSQSSFLDDEVHSL